MGRHRGTNKTHKQALYCSFGPPGVPRRKNTSYFTGGSEPTLVATNAFGTPVRRVSRSGAPLTARNRKTPRTAGLRVAVSLVWLLGPRGPPEGARRGPGAPKGTQNTTDSADFRKTIKNKRFDNVDPSRGPGPFWPTRAPDRTPITTDWCVLRRGIKSSPREPKGRKSVPGDLLKAV